MADYFPVLSDAVSKLENNTSESRRAVYDRARGAIVRQLRAIDPPLSDEVVAREQSQLEDAIRRVEANAAAAAKPAAAPPRPEPAAARPAAAAPRDEKRSLEPEPKRPAAPPAAPAQAKRGPKGQGGQKRPDGRPVIRIAGGKDVKAPKQRSGAMVGLAAIAAILIGVGLFTARGRIAEMFGGGATSTSEQAAAPETQPKPAEPAPQDSAKNEDRVPQDGVATPPAQQPDRQAALEQPPAAPPAQPAEPAPAAAPPAETAQPAETPSQPGPLVAQGATLYEEGPNKQSGEAVSGTVLWRSESIPAGQGQPVETAIRGDIDIPGRKLKGSILIRRNIDPTLPASHTIEIQFQIPQDFPNAGIANVPGILMKAAESARGAPVSGLSVRVTNGFFLIGLSSLEMERTVNEQLLRDRGWLDVPLLFENGRRAVLTLEKGSPGAQIFQEAFAAWKSQSAASSGSSAPQP